MKNKLTLQIITLIVVTVTFSALAAILTYMDWANNLLLILISLMALFGFSYIAVRDLKITVQESINSALIDQREKLLREKREEIQKIELDFQEKLRYVTFKLEKPSIAGISKHKINLLAIPVMKLPDIEHGSIELYDQKMKESQLFEVSMRVEFVNPSLSLERIKNQAAYELAKKLIDHDIINLEIMNKGEGLWETFVFSLNIYK